jgi:hypothetical protein
VKEPIHLTCPNRNNSRSYAYLTGKHPTHALFRRDPDTRTMKHAGTVCDQCGAVKMDGWDAWLTLQAVR